eukprot:1666999-Lingulodinium_polyedra.AAC.1
MRRDAVIGSGRCGSTPGTGSVLATLRQGSGARSSMRQSGFPLASTRAADCCLPWSGWVSASPRFVG